MKNLFGDNGAIFSDDRKYRYCLFRIWDENKPKVMFIGLNPSTANESDDDPTIRRVISFASRLGFGGVYMMNLFAWVTPKPEELQKCPDHLQRNNNLLKHYSTSCAKIIFAWGGFNEAREQSQEVIRMFPGAEALIVNKDGSPRHPLYVKGDTIPKPYKL